MIFCMVVDLFVEILRTCEEREVNQIAKQKKYPFRIRGGDSHDGLMGREPQNTGVCSHGR